jgi:hypothetical protein
MTYFISNNSKHCILALVAASNSYICVTDSLPDDG